MMVLLNGTDPLNRKAEMTKDITPAIDAPLGTKRHVGRTGPRVDPTEALSTLIRFTREAAKLSRPQLCKLLPSISVASLHTLEHERAPRDGELAELLPVLATLVTPEQWNEFGGNEFYEVPVKKVRAPRKPAAKKDEQAA